MIKFFCDCCQKEINNPDFMFEATLMEIKTGYDLINPKLNPQKQMHKRLIQICKECFDKYFAKLLKNEKL